MTGNIGERVCTYLPSSFRFGASSAELQDIKNALLSGYTLEISVIDGDDGDSPGEPQFMVLYFSWTYEHALNYVLERFESGSEVHLSAKRFVTMIERDLACLGGATAHDADFVHYLIPEAGCLGMYTSVSSRQICS